LAAQEEFDGLIEFHPPQRGVSQKGKKGNNGAKGCKKIVFLKLE
jgi:hypothetical protein